MRMYWSSVDSETVFLTFVASIDKERTGRYQGPDDYAID
jgi:hypothetical protein